MSHEFTSGVMMHGKSSWHGLENEVIEGTLPPREAFERAGALFPVEKAELWLGNPEQAEEMISVKQHTVGVWRPDTRQFLGAVSPGYPVYPNELLLRFAEGIADHIEMDTVIVLAEGRRVAFTGQLIDTPTEVLPGDTVFRNIVGYLGHDGKSALAGQFSNIRAECRNTLDYGINLAAAGRSTCSFRLPHVGGFATQEDAIAFVESRMDEVINDINFARQSFPEDVANYQAMTQVGMTTPEFIELLFEVYQIPPTFLLQGVQVPMTLDRAMPRKGKALLDAWRNGLGSQIPGVANTLWAALNAITQVESSTRDLSPKQLARKLNATYFGAAANNIRRTEMLIRQRLSVAA